MRTAKVEVGSTVCVIGAGGIGLAAIQGARIAGAGKIIVVDVSAGKLETAGQLGGTHFVNGAESEDVVAEVKELSGGGVDFSFEAIGRADTVRQAFDMLAIGGTATVIGMVPSKDVVQLRGIDFLSEKKLQGTMMGSNRFRTDIPRMIDMYLDGRLLLDEMVSATIGLDAVNDGYRMMKNGEGARTVITFD